ncbi:hypothetical protein GEMRC1_013882 [Eukaryota sp. GEM-RC1]
MVTMWLEMLKSQNPSIKEIDISTHFIEDSRTFVSLFSTSSLKCLLFSQVDCPDESLSLALKDNLSLQQLCLYATSLNVAEVLQFNTCLKHLEFSRCELSYEPLFKSLETNSSLLELSIYTDETLFNDCEFQSLLSMIQQNTGLLVLSLGESLFDSLQFKRLIDAFPHSIDDVSISYEYCLVITDCDSILKFLKLHIAIKHIKSKGLKISNFAGFLTLLEIFSLQSSLIDTQFVSVSHHFLNLESGVIRLSPENLTFPSDSEVAALVSYIRLFRFQELTIQRCSFTEESISILCDFFREDVLLTSVDFSGCMINDDSLIRLATSIQANRRSKLLSIRLNGFVVSPNTIKLVEKFLTTLGNVQVKWNGVRK